MNPKGSINTEHFKSKKWGDRREAEPSRSFGLIGQGRTQFVRLFSFLA